MKTRTSQIILALLTSLLASCSKHPSLPAANSRYINFGVVAVSGTGTNQFDSDLGDGKVCVVKSFVITDQPAGPMVVSSAAVEVRDSGGSHTLVTFDAKTNLADQPVEFWNSDYDIRALPHIKP